MKTKVLGNHLTLDDGSQEVEMACKIMGGENGKAVYWGVGSTQAKLFRCDIRIEHPKASD